MGYVEVYTTGNLSANEYRNLSIYEYPNTSTQDSLCEKDADKPDVYSGLKGMADQLVNNGIIDYAEILIDYSHPHIDGNDARDYRTSFRNWLDNQGISWNGVHFLAAAGFAGGNAEVPTSESGSALVNDQCTILGCGSTRQWIRNASSHEALHTIIDSDTAEVRKMSEHYNNGGHRQHDLGTVLSGAGDSSPLCTSYEDTHGRHDGDLDDGCATDYPNVSGVYNETLTSCTKTGVKETVNSLK
jgi:hypothetical protein